MKGRRWWLTLGRQFGKVCRLDIYITISLVKKLPLPPLPLRIGNTFHYNASCIHRFLLENFPIYYQQKTVRGRIAQSFAKKNCTKFAHFHCVKCVRPIKLSCYGDICIFVQEGGILVDFTSTSFIAIKTFASPE